MNLFLTDFDRFRTFDLLPILRAPYQSFKPLQLLIIYFVQNCELCRCNRETEVRKLSLVQHYGLVQVLEMGSAWREVMVRVRRTPTDTLPCPIKYRTEHIQ